MFNLLLILLFITCLGITAAWMAENPGQVTIYWFDWRIDTSFAFLMLLALATIFIAAYSYIILRRILLAPRHVSTSRRLKRYQRGLSELTYSVAALAAADIKHAERHTRKAEKLLGRTPLTLLLTAQIARSRGDDLQTRALLEAMLDHEETEYLAARSLSDSASKQQLFPKALGLAKRASDINPKDTAALSALIGLNIRLGQWQEAMHAIDKSAWKNGLRHADRQHYKALVHLKQGMGALADHRIEAAVAHARSAIRLQPDFVPAIAFAAKAFAACGEQGKATRLITRAWRKAPHPELTAGLRDIVDREPKAKQLKLVRTLVAIAPKDPESGLAMAQVAIGQKEWEMARKALKAVLANQETARACKLMAELEQGEFSDFDAVGRWMARSVSAIPDSAWTCRTCGHGMEKWDTHCGSCGAFDTLEWRERTLRFAA